MRSLRSSASSLLLVAGLFVPSAALADAPRDEDSTRAQELFEEGVALLQRGDFAAACTKLSASHTLDPAGGTALDIGFCEEKQGHFASALAAYEDALRRATTDGRADRERLAGTKIAELRPLVSHIQLKLAPVVRAQAGLVVSLDGRTLDDPEKPLPSDARTRTITVAAPGKQTFSRTFDVPNDASTIAIDVIALEDDAQATQTPAVAQPPIGAPTREEALTSDSRKVTALALGVGGIALLGAGAAFGFAAASKHSDSDRLCAGGCTADGASAERDANHLAWASNIGIGTGLVLGGVSLYLLLTSPAKPTPPSTTSTAGPMRLRF
jgi:hypothetical protein